MDYSVNERIKNLIESRKESVRAFSSIIGIPQTTLNSIVLNTRKANVEVIEAIIDKIKNINPFWLINGKGEMYTTTPSDIIPKLLNDETTKAPLITQYAYGGYLRGFADSEFREAQPIYVASKRYSGGNYVAFEVRGDSMDDGSKKSICNGDIVDGQNWTVEYKLDFLANGPVRIPSGLESILEEMKLKDCPPNNYIFSHYLKPGKLMLVKADHVTAMHKLILKSLNIPHGKTLYSWKHTGVVDYYNAIRDPFPIMQQLRHHSLSITMVYLKSLGLQPNSLIRNAELKL